MTKVPVTGLSFSEFVEFICRVAIVGMQHVNYEVVFPTPLSKILAMLVVFGVADMNKLKEVHIVRAQQI